jgi:hypothetical protein
MRHIHVSDVDGKPAACFDTGLEPRSFARTKMSQCLIETGYIVHPDGTHKIWKATGVNEVDGFMRVWGVPFTGERLDVLLAKAALDQESSRQQALQAIVYWIHCKLLLGDVCTTLNPGAVFISCEETAGVPNGADPKGSVFFAPENLSQRCLLMEGAEIDYFNCPDLKDMDAAAFCAGAMLYKVLTNANPYPDRKNIYQDMREGILLPLPLASPGIDETLSELIQTALLLPVKTKKTSISGTKILSGMLEVLMNKEGETVAVSSLYKSVSAEAEQQIKKTKSRYLSKQNLIIKAKRFYLHYKPVVWGTAVAILFLVFVIGNLVTSRRGRPTTMGMSAETVVKEYYEAFSNLDHVFMEACLVKGASRSDVDAAINLFVVVKARQAYENTTQSSIIPAQVWRAHGGELPAPDVFGVTDLTFEREGGSELEGLIVYRTEYLLWFPHEPVSSSRSDRLILRRQRAGNWKIAEIRRTLNNGF